MTYTLGSRKTDTDTSATPASASRERVSRRLLRGSLTRSYEPTVDIDWEAPLDPDKYFLPPQLLSLYGTPMWEQMSEQQRIELSRQEMANVLSVGIWFENFLGRILFRALLDEDPSSAEVHYALTELGDETRHMIMFGRVIDACGARPYMVPRWQRPFSKAAENLFRGSMLWIGALIGEEIFDALQRRMMADPQLQPMVARLMSIHVTEEARHIRFARDGVRRRMADCSRTERVLVGNLNGLGGPMFRYLLTNRTVYRRAGLDAREAQRQARANPNYRHAQVAGFESFGRFLEEVGLMRRGARALWRRAGFLE